MNKTADILVSYIVSGRHEAAWRAKKIAELEKKGVDSPGVDANGNYRRAHHPGAIRDAAYASSVGIMQLEGKRIAGIKSKDSQAQVVAIISKKGRDAEVQKRTRVSNSKRAAASAPKAVAVPGTPFVKRFLSRLEALTNDLESEFKAKVPEEIAARFFSEFDATDPILIAQFRRAMIGMRAVAIVVAQSHEAQAA